MYDLIWRAIPFGELIDMALTECADSLASREIVRSVAK